MKKQKKPAKKSSMAPKKRQLNKSAGKAPEQSSLEKKASIERELIKFGKRISFLKKKRDSLVSGFIVTLKDKRLEQIRKLLNQ